MEKIILFTAVMTFLNMCCFLFGINICQKIQSGKEIKTPKIEPIKTIKEFNANRETKKEVERARIINENIDNYNGTSIGQQDIPR